MLQPDQLQRLAAKYQLTAFYLFGSFADGGFTDESDIDLAYLSNRKENHPDNGALYFDIKQFLSREVDLVDLRRVPPAFAFQIVREGRVIYDRDPEIRTDFEDELIRNYLDFAVVNRMMHEDIAANFSGESGQ